MEIWKDIKNYEGIYQISNLGRVKSLIHNKNGTSKKEKFLKSFDSGKGYQKVYLYKNKKQSSLFLHRLVAEEFIENPKNYKCVNHKDENKSNNKFDNLEWCDYKYNNNYKNHNRKLSISKRNKNKNILQFDLKHNFIKEFNSIKDAEEETKILNISKVCLKKQKHAGNYIWEYANEK